MYGKLSTSAVSLVFCASCNSQTAAGGICVIGNTLNSTHFAFFGLIVLYYKMIESLNGFCFRHSRPQRGKDSKISTILGECLDLYRNIDTYHTTANYCSCWSYHKIENNFFTSVNQARTNTARLAASGILKWSFTFLYFPLLDAQLELFLMTTNVKPAQWKWVPSFLSQTVHSFWKVLSV